MSDNGNENDVPIERKGINLDPPDLIEFRGKHPGSAVQMIRRSEFDALLTKKAFVDGPWFPAGYRYGTGRTVSKYAYGYVEDENGARIVWAWCDPVYEALAFGPRLCISDEKMLELTNGKLLSTNAFKSEARWMFTDGKPITTYVLVPVAE